MTISHIDLKLKINPLKQKLDALAFLTIKDVGSDINLFLNRKLDWAIFKIEKNKKKIILEAEPRDAPEDSFLKPVKIWNIQLPEEFINTDEILLECEYSGTIESDPWNTNYIREDAVELGCYVAFYPIEKLEDKPTFSVVMRSPDEWTWVMNSDRLGDCKCNIWVTEEKRTDLYLIGLPNQLSIEFDEEKRFWGAKRNYEKFKSLENELSKIEKKLREWLGESKVIDFKIVLVPRDSGGLISREGIIAMQDTFSSKIIDKKRELLLLSWAHEITHFWFNKTSPSTYHNWLDEALCDYCALVIGREIYGQKFYEDQIENIKTKIKSEDLPAIKDIVRNNPKAELTFYKYGSLVLQEIEQLIGDEKFKKLLRNFAQKSLKKDWIETADFIDSIDTITGTNWTDFFEDKLSNKPRVE